MPTTINSVLGELPSGKVAPLSDEQLGRLLRDGYLGSEAEKKRIAKSEKRLDLFCDRTTVLYNDIVDSVFTHDRLKADYKAFVRYARYQNVSRRIVEEISTTDRISSQHNKPARATHGTHGHSSSQTILLKT